MTFPGEGGTAGAAAAGSWSLRPESASAWEGQTSACAGSRRRPRPRNQTGLASKPPPAPRAWNGPALSLSFFTGWGVAGLTKHPPLSGSPEGQSRHHVLSSWCAEDANGCELGLGAACDFIIFKSHSRCPLCWGGAKETGAPKWEVTRGVPDLSEVRPSDYRRLGSLCVGAGGVGKGSADGWREADPEGGPSLSPSPSLMEPSLHPAHISPTRGPWCLQGPPDPLQSAGPGGGPSETMKWEQVGGARSLLQTQQASELPWPTWKTVWSECLENSVERMPGTGPLRGEGDLRWLPRTAPDSTACLQGGAFPAVCWQDVDNQLFDGGGGGGGGC